jgi:hypothetical protein
MTDQFSNDPWAAAMEPAEITYSNDIYGQIEFDVWFCTLKKGVGKQVFIPDVDRLSDRRTAITIMLSDLGGNSYKREFIGEIPTDGWKGITLPSIEALGIDIKTNRKAIDGQFVHAEMVKFATYKKSDGTEGVKTAPKILTVYKSREECEAAAQGAATQAEMFTAAPSGVPSANGAATAAVNDAEKKVAAAFLLPIVKGAVRGNGVDSAALDAALKSNPILAKYFTLASPEVTEAMAQALAEPAF